VVVSSGAIAGGVARLGWKERPTELALKQAAASIGQVALMEAYERALSADGILPAQILLTRDDLMKRERYLNIRTTLLQLLSLRVIPVINENDTVSTEEIQFGDNDTLSATVAIKVEADKLILLSDVPGFFEQASDGKLTSNVIRVVEKVTPAMEKAALRTTGSKMSVGGIVTKLSAAKMAAAAGVETWLASGYEADSILKVVAGDASAGTRFATTSAKRIGSRESWIAFARPPKGFLVLDDGALKAVIDGRKSLLPSGVRRVHGAFAVGDTVGLRDADGTEVARGLVNFSSEDVKAIRGHHSREIAGLLGRAAAGEVIHRVFLFLI
jgi:glutamate 5-kinase